MKVNTVVCRENIQGVYEIGNALNIEESQSQWKLSQAVSRESGRLNKELVHVSNEEFVGVTKIYLQDFQKLILKEELLLEKMIVK